MLNDFIEAIANPPKAKDSSLESLLRSVLGEPSEIRCGTIVYNLAEGSKNGAKD